jgi:GNAT superfamily N-acetyltransferase
VPRGTSAPAARIRAATAADAAVLASLRLELRTGVSPDVVPEEGFQARCAAWMADRLAGRGTWHCWLAEETDGTPLGTVWVEIIERLPNPEGEPELHGYLTGFYVRAAARNRGVGSALLEAALARCAELRADTVFLWPTPRSRVLYARYGFTQRSGILERRIEYGPPGGS